MSILIGTLTSKGQTTIPAEIREYLGLQPGDKIRYIKRENEVVIKAKNRRAIEFAGLLHDPGRPALSIEELEQAIQDSVAAGGIAEE